MFCCWTVSLLLPSALCRYCEIRRAIFGTWRSQCILNEVNVQESWVRFLGRNTFLRYSSEGWCTTLSRNAEALSRRYFTKWTYTSNQSCRKHIQEIRFIFSTVVINLVCILPGGSPLSSAIAMELRQIKVRESFPTINPYLGGLELWGAQPR